jgi:adenosine deaminase
MKCHDWLTQLPKIDLHCHFDGSLSIPMMEEYLSVNGLAQPGETHTYSVAEDCPSLVEYLKCFDLPVSCLQTPNAIALFLQDMLRSAAAEHIFYLEVRFAPQLHTQGGLTLEQVFQAMALGKALGEAESGVRCSILACAMRHFSPAENLQMLEEAAKWYPTLVSGLDLAGDEANHATREQEAFFLRAKELGIPFTIHSGETGRLDNLEDALRYGAQRVGHGIALQKSPQLMEAYANAGIGVELCPVSNLQTKAVQNWAEYPFQTFDQQGLAVTVNTDNRTVSATTLVHELEQLICHCGLTPEQTVAIMHNANRLSFAPPEGKEDYERELTRFLRRNPISALEDWA